MGSSQEYSPTNSNRKDDFFDQAEQAAFQHVNANLRDMPYCDRGDLEQAAKSYFFQSVNASGAGHLFREAYVEGKAATWAAWWFRKHRDRRTPRPHSLYSIDQARRGGKHPRSGRRAKRTGGLYERRYSGPRATSWHRSQGNLVARFARFPT